MKIVTRTPKKVILEVEESKIEKCGFDFVWDEIRDKFPEDKFGKLIVEQNEEKSIVVFELLNNKEPKKNNTQQKKPVRKPRKAVSSKKKEEVEVKKD